MGKEYLNPPIIEAICEIRLNSKTNWDMTYPGLLYEKIKADFPIKEQSSSFFPETDHINTQGLQKFTQREFISFYTNDRKCFIRLSPNLISIHCLKPYPSWNRFKPLVELIFQKFAEIVGAVGIQRIGLRYINSIEIPGEEGKGINLDHYFHFRPHLGNNLPQNINGFIIGCTLPFFENRDFCKTQLTQALSETPEKGVFLLDLDYFPSKVQDFSMEQATGWVETAHEKIGEVFEGCITDQLRSIFGEVP